MKRLFVSRVCLLLLWMLTAPDSGNGACVLKVAEVPKGIKLSCGDECDIRSEKNESINTLEYKEENTGEYRCVQNEGLGDISLPKIYVKFRTCDNCIELDEGTITGIIVGDVVATIVIGVAVYLIASQTRTAPVPSQKKSSDRQHLVPSEGRRAPNDLYQPLKGRQKETYDVLNRR